MALNVKAAAMMSIIAEQLLYGFSILMFGATARILISDALKRRPNWIMMVASAAFFILSTVHMVVVVLWVYEGFVRLNGRHLTSYFNSSAHPYVTAKNIAYLLETTLADMILNVWVILPSSLTAAASAALMSWVFAHITRSGEHWFVGSAERILYAAYAFMLFTSLASTSLLGYKLWITERFMSRYRQNLFGPSIEIVVQCGALYSLTLIMVVLTTKLSYFASYVAVNVAGQIIPITFYAIILRVRIARRRRDEAIAMSTWRSGPGDESIGHGVRDAEIEVHISRFCEESREFVGAK
ncbi:hypothetical protein CONPUDRAFT_149238 [Coniophora puteana RWD-64-598 SS2]|uniref:Uncharacterized protein n=1 Tax=Coniophora puteana (strain RWD-64-598) TaxID=741705 RepID=A0A5M3N7E5_CONPW|nr:uncharacterized protein CONPUDRAFT_149238 [Coniophora puteana RWD-64-598 SS2]EIW87208.1 hypothetical protein CONPUDRAFT_149238 [Coniophora puteana RWD-64-598 SS2]